MMIINCRRVRRGNSTVYQCGYCGGLSSLRHKLCSACGATLHPRPYKKTIKPRRGTPDRLRLDLKHANKQAKQWADRLARSVNTWQKWVRRVESIERRLAQVKHKQKPIRAIDLEMFNT